MRRRSRGAVTSTNVEALKRKLPECKKTSVRPQSGPVNGTRLGLPPPRHVINCRIMQVRGQTLVS